jgi:beta-glucosidase
MPGISGTRTGDAIASVLYTATTIPGGKITFSWPYSVGQIPNVLLRTKIPAGREIPISGTHPNLSTRPTHPLFPFGYGLSYTTFEYDNLSLSETEISGQGELSVSIDITNGGDMAGYEIVQLYTRKMVASVTQPVRQLRNFEKIYLEPGETKTVEFQLTANELTYLNQELKPVLEPGTVKVFVGRNVADTLEAEFEVL